MELRCKVCEEQGIIAPFKNRLGLWSHVRTKHKLTKDEYIAKYEEIEMPVKTTIEKSVKIEEPVKEVSEITPEPIKMQETEPEPEETNIEEPRISIRHYTLLNNSNLRAVFTDNTKYILRKIVAIATVKVNNEKVVSTMIIGDDGMLTPTFIIPGFVKVVEGKVKLPRRVPSEQKKNKKSLHLFKKPKKEEMKTSEKISTDELIVEFSKYMQTREEENKE